MSKELELNILEIYLSPLHTFLNFLVKLFLILHKSRTEKKKALNELATII